ncbi:MAG TPA: bifunctional phosphoribosylaminoimidazolecarboxamide formyltransferase/IMP cyclohydrolase [Bryobacteraceae bacterium]
MSQDGPGIGRALLSVTDKTGIVEFARFLSSLNVEMLSTGGTFRVLKDAGVGVREVAETTQFPEMLDGRVKTLHPRIAGGILAVRSNQAHMQALAQHGIPTIDLVAVNLYDFAAVAAQKDASREELIEQIDIGGPTMIRAAAKNWQDVAVVVSPEDYPAIMEELRETGGRLSRDTRWSLALKAFSLTAAYDRAISARLPEIPPAHEPLPAILDIRAPRTLALRYGENPHQSAALYASGAEGIAGAEKLHGPELSYNNLVDLDAAWQLIQEFESPAAAIIKHTNPCGCAEGETLAAAYARALEADPISAFGGILSFNREVDGATAAEVARQKLDAIAAPGYSLEAMGVLGTKKNVRLVRVKPVPAGGGAPELIVKSVSGGFLAQTPDVHSLSRAECRVATQREPTPEEWEALEFAWKVCKHVKSNAIVYARRGQTVSVGAGQMSRVDSVKVGAMKALLPLPGCVVASDAFFPFADGIEEAARHGVTAVIQPGGSTLRGPGAGDEGAIAAANLLGLAMVFTGVRHFRH